MASRYSLITDDMDHCFICGKPRDHIHHCIYGSRRHLADEDGLIVPLCLEHHNEVHEGDGSLAMFLKQEAQRAYEETYGHEAYMKRYGKNYLD